MIIYTKNLEGELEKLQRLKKQIDKHGLTVGFPGENRDFSPHITLARIKKLGEVKKIYPYLNHDFALDKNKDKFPIQLSGGEMQKAAIARALVLSPEILLADEPTGNLDITTSWEIVKLLSDINEKGTTVIMATHNVDIVNKLSKRVIKLEKGRLIRDDKNKSDVKAENKPEEKSEEKK